jgi:hypothetical protein
MRDREALEIAGRLESLGVVVKSPELLEAQQSLEKFAKNGNRGLRRDRERAARKRGRGVTR